MRLPETIAHCCMLTVLVCVVAGLVSSHPAAPGADDWLDAPSAGLSIACIPGAALHRPFGVPAGAFGSVSQPVLRHISGFGRHVRSLWLSDCIGGIQLMRRQSLS
jgi:hypothetical protein